MPWTADQKRRRRAEQAQVAGKRFKPRKHPCLLEQPPPALDAPSAPRESQLTVEEEMNRSLRTAECAYRVSGRPAPRSCPSIKSGFHQDRWTRCVLTMPACSNSAAGMPGIGTDS